MVRDWHNGKPTRLTGLPGAKPDAFNEWVLNLLNYHEGDDLVDLYPGTAGMQHAVDRLNLWRLG
jgi:hypothetical protein